ncbi:MAG: hypothetical protein K0Q90_3509 [Paenibacillaceae bacterium]|jgi:hypothetical protein|nr:hypothetical protein [Paenibacillaceae bacterium]
MNKYRRFGSLGIPLLLLLTLGITALLFLWIGLQASFSGHWWISLCGFIIAEAAIFFYLNKAAQNRRRAQQVPTLLAPFTLIVGYAALLLVYMIFFWGMFKISFLSYLLLHGITTAVLAAGLVLLKLYKGYVEDQDTTSGGNTSVFAQIQQSLQALRMEAAAWSSVKGDPVLRLLEQASEKARFSDPVTHASLIPIEENLLWQIRELEKCLQLWRKGDSGNGELARQLLDDIMGGLAKRNSRLLALK